MEHWTNEFNHPKFDTLETQESAKSILGKFATKDDAVAGYVELQKTAGRPFKLPESLDKLPDDNVRNDFKKQAMKVLGIESPVTSDTIKQVNWLKGLPDGEKGSETLINKFTEFAVKKGFTLAQIQDLVEFNNNFGTEVIKAANQERENAMKTVIDESNKELTQFYGADKLKENAELLRRAVQNHQKLSTEEKNKIAEDLMEGGYIFSRPALTKLLFEHVAHLAKESTTETGTPKIEPKEEDSFEKTNPVTAAIWKKK